MLFRPGWLAQGETYALELGQLCQECGPALSGKGLESARWHGTFAPMKAAQLDDQRRLVMPETCPARSAVTVDEIDDRTWIVRRHAAQARFKLVAIPILDRLKDNPEMDRFGLAAVRSQTTYPEP